MILAYLLLITGLTISSVAIYYSVVGLTAIFSAAAIPIMIMGASLEVAKLVCATWIKQYWTQVPRLMKTYMVIAIVILMLITSMGIFGFLSKAHNDQNLVSGDVQSKIAIYDEKIRTARDNIDAGRKQLRQMDDAVDQVMARSTSETGADKSVAIRRSQAKDRASLARDIESNQKLIAQLNDEAAPIRAEVRKVDAEVGPIKYIAAFIYGTTPDANMLEKAVTWIIILIVIVFDPLAVIMLLASQMTFGWRREIRQARASADDDGMVDSDPTIMPPPKTIFNAFADALEKRISDYHNLRERFKPKSKIIALTPELEEELGKLEPSFREGDYSPYVPHQNLVDVLHDLGDVPVFEQREELPLEVEEPVVDEHPFRGKGVSYGMPMTASYMQPKLVGEVQTEIVPAESVTPFTFEMIDDEPVEEMFEDKPESVIEEEPVLITRIAFPESNYNISMDERPGDYVETPNDLLWTPATQVDEDEAVKQLIDIGYLTNTGEVNPEYVPDETGIAPDEAVVETTPVTAVTREAAPGRNRHVMHSHIAVEADNAPVLGKASHSDFGNTFPTNPEKGDTYLRTDYLPNRLFKFNDYKWIEVDKDNIDVYAYEEEYIKHLINEIAEGRYDVDSLSDLERSKIEEFLKK